MTTPCIALPNSNSQYNQQQEMLNAASTKIDKLIALGLILPDYKSGLRFVAGDNSRFVAKEALLSFISCGSNGKIGMNYKHMMSMLDEIEKLAEPLAKTKSTEIFATNLNKALWLDYYKNKVEFEYNPALLQYGEEFNNRTKKGGSSSSLGFFPSLVSSEVDHAKDDRAVRLDLSADQAKKKFEENSSTLNYSAMLINAEKKFQGILGESLPQPRTKSAKILLNRDNVFWQEDKGIQQRPETYTAMLPALFPAMGRFGAMLATFAVSGWASYEAFGKVADRVYGAEQKDLQGDLLGAMNSKLKIAEVVSTEIGNQAGQLKEFMAKRYDTAAGLRQTAGLNAGIRAGNSVRAAGEPKVADAANPEIAPMADLVAKMTENSMGIDAVRRKLADPQTKSSDRAGLEKELAILLRQKELLDGALRGAGVIRRETKPNGSVKNMPEVSDFDELLRKQKGSKK